MTDPLTKVSHYMVDFRIRVLVPYLFIYSIPRLQNMLLKEIIPFVTTFLNKSGLHQYKFGKKFVCPHTTLAHIPWF